MNLVGTFFGGRGELKLKAPGKTKKLGKSRC